MAFCQRMIKQKRLKEGYVSRIKLRIRLAFSYSALSRSPITKLGNMALLIILTGMLFVEYFIVFDRLLFYFEIRKKIKE